MKRIISALLIFTLTFAICGCEPKATEKPEETVKPVETLDITDLSEYTIVYPATYSEWKMQEVDFLKSVLSTVTKAEIKAIPDSETSTGKEIILASSARVTRYAEKISSFDNAMCYVVGFDGDNIVLGGQNFYSDMRAIYDFVNNTLNYDDINDVYGTPSTKLEAKEVLWSEPEFQIMGSNFSANVPMEAWQVKDFADCGFTILWIHFNNSKWQQNFVFRDCAKLCARFGIQCMYMPAISFETDKVGIKDEEDIIENPAMWGLYIIDEPKADTIEHYSLALKDAKERFGKYGWKFYINFIGYTQPDWYDENETRYAFFADYLTDVDAVSQDMYFNNYQGRFNCNLYGFEFWKRIALEFNKDYYVYIQAFQDGDTLVNTTKNIRSNSYIGFCFDAKMIEYFQYGDASAHIKSIEDGSYGSLVNKDFSKNPAWYDAQEVNVELNKVYDILKNYDYIGTNAFASQEEQWMISLEDPYFLSMQYITFRDNPYDASGVYGLFYDTETNGRAVVLTSLDELDQYDYDTSKNVIHEVDGDRTYETRYTHTGEAVTDWFTNKTITVKLVGNNIKIYKDGELYSYTANADGSITIPFNNGDCYVFTTEAAN